MIALGLGAGRDGLRNLPNDGMNDCLHYHLKFVSYTRSSVTVIYVLTTKAFPARLSDEDVERKRWRKRVWGKSLQRNSSTSGSWCLESWFSLNPKRLYPVSMGQLRSE